ncbi:MAG: hypothetical protein GY941_21735 [Planctomycetes bacterium]|nr:hypothetical protein [Planctomycetota bacterium]
MNRRGFLQMVGCVPFVGLVGKTAEPEHNNQICRKSRAYWTNDLFNTGQWKIAPRNECVPSSVYSFAYVAIYNNAMTCRIEGIKGGAAVNEVFYKEFISSNLQESSSHNEMMQWRHRGISCFPDYEIRMDNGSMTSFKPPCTDPWDLPCFHIWQQRDELEGSAYVFTTADKLPGRCKPFLTSKFDADNMVLNYCCGSEDPCDWHRKYGVYSD